MAFALSEDQEMIRKVVRDFVERVVAPAATRIDHERVFPRGILAKSAELGLLGMLVPADKGGAGTDTLSFVVAIEEVSKSSGTTALAMAIENALVTWPIATHGGEGLRDVLAKLISGERLGAFAFSEPGAGTDPGSVRTRARSADGGVLLDGLKSFVVGGEEADAYLVIAREGEGMSAFLVDREAKGVLVGPVERSMTMRGAGMTQVFFKGVKVPEAARVGPAGKGLEIATESLALARLAGAAMAVGFMQEALDASREYSGERQQFRQPIKNFQVIQWKIAEMDTDARAARLLTYAAAARRDAGEPWDEDLAAAKLFAGEAAKHNTQQALRIHGGTGFMREVPMERLNRDARAVSLFAGSSEMERAALAAKLLDL